MIFQEIMCLFNEHNNLLAFDVRADKFHWECTHCGKQTEAGPEAFEQLIG